MSSSSSAPINLSAQRVNDGIWRIRNGEMDQGIISVTSQASGSPKYNTAGLHATIRHVEQRAIQAVQDAMANEERGPKMKAAVSTQQPAAAAAAAQAALPAAPSSTAPTPAAVAPTELQRRAEAEAALGELHNLYTQLEADCQAFLVRKNSSAEIRALLVGLNSNPNFHKQFDCNAANKLLTLPERDCNYYAQKQAAVLKKFQKVKSSATSQTAQQIEAFDKAFQDKLPNLETLMDANPHQEFVQLQQARDVAQQTQARITMEAVTKANRAHAEIAEQNKYEALLAKCENPDMWGSITLEELEAVICVKENDEDLIQLAGAIGKELMARMKQAQHIDNKRANIQALESLLSKIKKSDGLRQFKHVLSQHVRKAKHLLAPPEQNAPQAAAAQAAQSLQAPAFTGFHSDFFGDDDALAPVPAKEKSASKQSPLSHVFGLFAKVKREIIGVADFLDIETQPAQRAIQSGLQSKMGQVESAGQKFFNKIKGIVPSNAPRAAGGGAGASNSAASAGAPPRRVANGHAAESAAALAAQAAQSPGLVGGWVVIPKKDSEKPSSANSAAPHLAKKDHKS